MGLWTFVTTHTTYFLSKPLASKHLLPYHVCHSVSVVVSYCQNPPALLYCSARQFTIVDSWCVGHQINPDRKIIYGIFMANPFHSLSKTKYSFHSPSEIKHCHMCSCNHVLNFAVLSPVYAHIVNLASHVAKIVNLYTKAIIFLMFIFVILYNIIQLLDVHLLPI